MLNAIVAAVKVSIGLIAHNLTVLADGFHSILDSTNNLVGIVAMGLALLPPDENHPYGHRKFEHVAAMLIGGLVMLLCWETMQNVFARFAHPPIAISAGESSAPIQWLFVALVVGAACINVIVVLYERHEGQRLSSSLLKADAKHTLSDTVVTIFGLLSLLIGSHYWWLDPILATGVILFLVHATWSILQENIATMTDQRRLDPVEVRTIAEAVDGVQNAHAIRSHGMENDIHLDLHIVVPESMTAGEVERLEAHVRHDLSARFPEVTLISVHHETEGASVSEPLWKT